MGTAVNGLDASHIKREHTSLHKSWSLFKQAVELVEGVSRHLQFGRHVCNEVIRNTASKRNLTPYSVKGFGQIQKQDAK